MTVSILGGGVILAENIQRIIIDKIAIMHLSLSLPPSRIILMLCCLLLVWPCECASSQKASLDIEKAIQAAIVDGLGVVDRSMRNTYWYFLHGGNLASYNVSVKVDRLNYIILYVSGSSVFRVNCDLTFSSWSPRLNSFVQVFVSQAALAAIKNDTTILGQSNNYLDLTDSGLAVTNPLPQSTPSTPQDNTSTDSSAPVATTNQPQTTSPPAFPSAAGVVVLKPISSNLSTAP